MKLYAIASPGDLSRMCGELLPELKDGRSLKIEVKHLAGKTKSQLAYYWGVVLPFVQYGLKQQGNELDLDQCNQFLNGLFFADDIAVIWRKNGQERAETLKTVRSKAGASKDEMKEFLDKVIRFAAEELGIVVPEPPDKED